MSCSYHKYDTNEDDDEEEDGEDEEEDDDDWGIKYDWWVSGEDYI